MFYAFPPYYGLGYIDDGYVLYSPGFQLFSCYSPLFCFVFLSSTTVSPQKGGNFPYTSRFNAFFNFCSIYFLVDHSPFPPTSTFSSYSLFLSYLSPS